MDKVRPNISKQPHENALDLRREGSSKAGVTETSRGKIKTRCISVKDGFDLLSARPSCMAIRLAARLDMVYLDLSLPMSKLNKVIYHSKISPDHFFPCQKLHNSFNIIQASSLHTPPTVQALSFESSYSPITFRLQSCYCPAALYI